MRKEVALIIGASGQIGTDLTLSLRELFGDTNVIASDIKAGAEEITQGGPFEILNVLDKESIAGVLKKYQVTQIYHLAAILSANAEKNPKVSWQINMDGLMNVLDLAKEQHVPKIFWPSSIAVFGPTTPRKNTPQYTVMEPTTIYGISKQAGERWCEYYFNNYDVDVRSLRYPGLISYKTEAGGGTTDYAVEIFQEAVKNKSYTCFLREDTRLPMMYMPDAIRATIELMQSDTTKVKIHSSYNIGSIDFTPSELYQEIKRYIPDLKISFKPDFRQKIADSWPQSIDDSEATKDWNWKPEFDVNMMTADMLKHIEERIAAAKVS